MLGYGPEQKDDKLDEDKDPMNWYRAFTLLKQCGHTTEDIHEMSPVEFRGYLREAKFLENYRLSQGATATLAAMQAAWGGEGAHDAFKQLLDTLKKEAGPCPPQT